MRPLISLAFFGLVFATVSNAGLELWSGSAGNVDINGNNATILAAGTFKFQSVTGGNLDVIGSITVADGVTGEVTVYIERDTDDDSPGATNMGAINLTNNQGASLTGNLAELRISGNLATDGDVSCDSVTGDIFVGLNTYNTLDLGDVDSSSTITITKDLEGTLSANTPGNVLIYGDAGPIAVPGDIIIAQNYAGTINVDHGGWHGRS